MTDTSSAPGPLAEASPTSLEELMSRDPLKLQRVDRDAIVRELRRMRAVWQQSEALAPSRKTAGKASEPVAPPSALDLGI